MLVILARALNEIRTGLSMIDRMVCQAHDSTGPRLGFLNSLVPRDPVVLILSSLFGGEADGIVLDKANEMSIIKRKGPMSN